MKAATGELSLTLITVVAIGAVFAFFNFLWPIIKEKVSGSVGSWDTDVESYKFDATEEYVYADYVYNNLV